MTNPKTELLVPEVVNVRFGDPQPDWLFPLVRLDRWSPFMAACIFLGLRPGTCDATTKIADAIWVRDADNPQGLPDNYENDINYGRELVELTEVIATNTISQGKKDVTPAEIVAWAIETQTISPDSEVARTFERRRIAKLDADTNTDSASRPTGSVANLAEDLRKAAREIGRLTTQRDDLAKKAKGTGKHFGEKREAILAAALHLLANHRDDCIDGNGRVVGAKLGNAVQDMRVYYGFGDDETNPAATTIIQTITDALSENRWARIGGTKI
jgi:hypothetical protein